MSFTADLRAVVRGVDFRRLYRTRLVSQTADGMVSVALTSFVFFSPERQATAADAAVAFATLLLPYSLVGPFAGVLLDRWRRRQVLVGASLARAGLICVVAFLVLAGYAGPGFYLAGLSVLSVNRFFLSALSAALPHVVPGDELVMANSVSTTSGTIAALLGAGAGFGVRQLAGGGNGAVVAVLGTAALVCVAAARLATRMDRGLLGPDAPVAGSPTGALRHVAAGMIAGARHVARRPSAGHALLAISAHRFVYGITTISTILLYRYHFNDAADTDAALRGLGLALAASGLGFLLAAVLTPELTPGRLAPGTLIAAAFVLAAAAEAFFVIGPTSQPTVLGGAFVLGVAAQGSKICVDTLVQQGVDDAYRGRVFSFYDVLFNVSFVSAAAAAVLVVPAGGYSRPLFAGLAAGYVLTAAGYVAAGRRGRVSVGG